MATEAPRVTSDIPHDPPEGHAYVVAFPLALIDCADGWVYTVYQGGPVPANVTPECLARLLDRGIVVPGVVKGGLAGAAR